MCPLEQTCHPLTVAVRPAHATPCVSQSLFLVSSSSSFPIKVPLTFTLTDLT